MRPDSIPLRTGRVYRTRELARWSSNPTRLAARLVEEGRLEKLRNGLYYSPEVSRFGRVPPSRQALLRAFFGRASFVVTGSERWNELGLGVTAVLTTPLIYNTKRTGKVRLGSHEFLLRRVRFPRRPSPEWFAVDLIENRAMAGVGRADLGSGLVAALHDGRLEGARLQEMAVRYGTRSTQALVRRACEAVSLDPQSPRRAKKT